VQTKWSWIDPSMGQYGLGYNGRSYNAGPIDQPTVKNSLSIKEGSYYFNINNLVQA